MNLTGRSGTWLEETARHYKNRLLKEANLEQLTRLPRAQLRQTLESLVSQLMTEERRSSGRTEPGRHLDSR